MGDGVIGRKEVEGEVPPSGTWGLSGTGDSQRDARESIRANHSHLKPLFLQHLRPIRTNHSNSQEGPTIKNFQSRSKCSISRENFNLDVSISPTKIGPQWVALGSLGPLGFRFA